MWLCGLSPPPLLPTHHAPIRVEADVGVVRRRLQAGARRESTWQLGTRGRRSSRRRQSAAALPAPALPGCAPTWAEASARSTSSSSPAATARVARRPRPAVGESKTSSGPPQSAIAGALLLPAALPSSSAAGVKRPCACSASTSAARSSWAAALKPGHCEAGPQRAGGREGGRGAPGRAAAAQSPASAHLLHRRAQVLQSRHVAAQVQQGAGQAVPSFGGRRVQVQRAAGGQEGLQCRKDAGSESTQARRLKQVHEPPRSMHALPAHLLPLLQPQVRCRLGAQQSGFDAVGRSLRHLQAALVAEERAWVVTPPAPMRGECRRVWGGQEAGTC